MQRISRIAAAVGLSAMLVTPALAHDGSGRGSAGLSFGLARKLFNLEQRVEMKEFKDKQKAERREWKEARATTTTETTTTTPAATPECMKPAIVKREDALIAAHTKMTTALNAALVARKTALLAAWDKTVLSERIAALTSAWSNYKTSSTAARKEFREAKLAAWTQYGTERRACGTDATGLEVNATVGVDAQL